MAIKESGVWSGVARLRVIGAITMRLARGKVRAA
jgi:hypothetical protein